MKVINNINKLQQTGNHAKSENSNLDSFFLAWYYLFQSVAVEQQTAQNQANELNSNTNLQQQLNGQISKINYVGFNPNESDQEEQKTMLSTQISNQEIQQEIDVYTNQNIVLRQSAQVLETSASTSTNNTEETQQEGTAILQNDLTMTREEFK